MHRKEYEAKPTECSKCTPAGNPQRPRSRPQSGKQRSQEELRDKGYVWTKTTQGNLALYHVGPGSQRSRQKWLDTDAQGRDDMNLGAKDMREMSVALMKSMMTQTKVNTKHVRLAQSQLEYDQVTPVVRTLPLHQKLVLFSICLNEENGLRNISTGEIYRTYSEACSKIGIEPLTTRRVSSLLNELDTIGLIMARNVSKGRGGRSKQVNSAIPKAIDAIALMSENEPLVSEAALGKYNLQGQL